MRDKPAFYRTNEVSREPTRKTDWLESFAEEMALRDAATKGQPQVKIASKTAVEVMRNRENEQSVYHMMSHILSPNKPKFSSVEDVVQHYQKQTGLQDHLKSVAEAKMKAMASIVAQAGDSNDVEWNPEKKG